ncbi:MAG: protein kinase [Thermodesulfovibrionales bacterium]|jgi:WD40 repeat protein
MSENDIPLNWQPGQVIAELYEVQDETAGGMGAVYFVKHLKWGIPLAVKTIRPEFVSEESAVNRFIKEAETWVNLGVHPHIASCYYVRVLEGLLGIFIEYVDGGDLRKWLKKDGKRGITEILDVAIQICRGMEYVHSKGVIHRDIKPLNCLLSKDGTVKVTDFGIAKAGQEIADTFRGRLGETSEGSMTMTGCGIGTPEYMSPEQFEDAKHTGKETDIYAFGVMLYEMVCRRKPFEMPHRMHDMAREHFFRKAHQEDLPNEPRALSKDCFPALNHLILACLAKVPEKRPDSFGEIEEVLLDVYKDISQRDYRRAKPDPLRLSADALNNRALSMLDLGREAETERHWEEALRNDPAHLETMFNQGYYLWQKGKLDPYAYFMKLKGLEGSQRDNPDYWHYLTLVCMDIGLEVCARVAAEKAVELGHELEMDIVRSHSSVVRVFEGHTEGVDSVAISPDGQYALSGSGDKTLRLWDIETGECLRVFEGHTHHVTAVAISPDGQYALSGSVINILSGSLDKKTPRLWDIETGECLRVFEGHTWSVNSVAISPDGRSALSGSVDKTLRLWDIETGECLRVFEGHTGSVNSVAISPDGGYALSGSGNKTLRLWDIETGECLRVFEGHTDGVKSVAISPDGGYALSGSGDKTLRLWDIETGECLRVFEGHTGGVHSVAISPDGQYALSGSGWDIFSDSRDDTLRLWDIETGECLRVFEGHTSYVNSVAISPDGGYALSCSWDNTLRLWEKTKEDTLFKYTLSHPLSFEDDQAKDEQVRALILKASALIKMKRYSEACTILTIIKETSDRSRDPEVLDMIRLCGLNASGRKRLNQFRVLQTLGGHTEGVGSAAISPDGGSALSGSYDKTLRLWDIETGECLRVFEGHARGILSVAISPDGRSALSGSYDKTLRLWDIETGECLRVFEGHTSYVYSVAISPGGGSALSGSGDKTLRLWDIETGECLRVFEGHIDDVYSVAISPDGGSVLSGSYDKTLRLWDIETGECLRVFEGSTCDVNSVAISPDGQYALSGGGWEKTLRLWDIETGECLRVFEGHTAYVYAVAISPGGGSVLSGSWDDTLRLWDIETGECLRVFEGHTAYVYAVAISPDGRFILSGSKDNTVKLWELDWEYEFDDDEQDEDYQHFKKEYDYIYTPILKMIVCRSNNIDDDILAEVDKEFQSFKDDYDYIYENVLKMIDCRIRSEDEDQLAEEDEKFSTFRVEYDYIHNNVVKMLDSGMKDVR